MSTNQIAKVDCNAFLSESESRNLSLLYHFGGDYTFVIDLAHRGVSSTVVEHWSAESEGLRFDSSWGLRIFLCPMLVIRRKNIFLCFFTKLKTYHFSYFYLQTLSYQHC